MTDWLLRHGGGLLDWLAVIAVVYCFVFLIQFMVNFFRGPFDGPDE
ncbi:MAG: hypothetical protein ACOY4H_14070 [Thermodesulfobacteriota bacterium]